MFLEEILPKNKDINYLEDKESKHPLLQLIYNTKQQKKVDENSSISISPKSSKYNSFTSLYIKNKNKNENNDLLNTVEENQSKLKKNNKNNNNSNIDEGKSVDNSNVNNSYNNKKNNNAEKINKIIDFSSDSNKSETKNNMKENKFDIMKEKSAPTSNNLFFPKISKPNNIKKDGDYNAIVNLKNNPQSLINNQKYNNNSIYISEPKIGNYSFLQKFNNDKTKYQKSIEFCLLRNKISNNSYNSRFLTFSTSNKISDIKNSAKSIELKENLKTIETDNSNKLKNNLFLRNSIEKSELNKKRFNRRKSVNYNYHRNLLNLEGKNNNMPQSIVNNKYLSKSKKNIYFSLPITEKQKSKPALNQFNDDTISISPILKERVNIKRFTIKKSTKIIKQMMGLGEIKETNDKNVNNNINSIENLNNNKNTETNFRYPYRRDIGKRMTQVYSNNFNFFNHLLDRKYEIINNSNNNIKNNMNVDYLKKNFSENKESIRKNIKHYTLMNILNKNKKTIKSILPNKIKKHNFNFINQKSYDKNYFVKEIISSRSESFSSSGNSENSDNTIILIHKKDDYNPFVSRSIFDNYIMDKDEEKYIKEKRQKIIDEAIEDNKSSYLFNIYNEELKNYYIKNCVVDKITENIFKNFEPLENKVETKKESEQKIKKCIKTSFKDILKKSHKYLSSFEKAINLGKSFIKEKNVKIEIKINSKYCLDASHIYKELLKQFELKWNNKKTKEYYYKKMIQVFTLEKKSKSQKYFYHNSNGIKKKKTLEKIDKDFYLYKESIKKDINLNINSLHLRLMNYNKTKIDKSRKSKFNSKLMVNTSKFYKNQSNVLNSKSLLSHLNIKVNNLGKSRENTLKITRKRRTSEDGGDNKRLSNFLKMQKEFGFNGKTESFEKFAKIYRISLKPKHSSKLDYIVKKFKEEFIEKKNKDAISQKELLFNQAKNDLDNYNILKNPKVFSYTINNQINIGKRFSKMFNLKKNQIQLDKKLKIDSMTIKFAGIDQLTKEAALIKTHEMENDLPDVKLFGKIVNYFQKRKISKFENLVKDRAEALNKIINKQEFTTGNTLLIYATQYNLKSIVELLLLKGADPNIQNKFGNSALHIAYKNDNVFIINLLIEHGADTKLKNSNRILPWQMSKFIN